MWATHLQCAPSHTIEIISKFFEESKEHIENSYVSAMRVSGHDGYAQISSITSPESSRYESPQDVIVVQTTNVIPVSKVDSALKEIKSAAVSKEKARQLKQLNKEKQLLEDKLKAVEKQIQNNS